MDRRINSGNGRAWSDNLRDYGCTADGIGWIGEKEKINFRGGIMDVFFVLLVIVTGFLVFTAVMAALCASVALWAVAIKETIDWFRN